MPLIAGSGRAARPEFEHASVDSPATTATAIADIVAAAVELFKWLFLRCWPHSEQNLVLSPAFLQPLAASVVAV